MPLASRPTPDAAAYYIMERMKNPAESGAYESQELLEERLDRLDAALTELTQEIRALRDGQRLLREVDARVESLVRMHVLDRRDLPYPYRLTANRFRIRSQRGEDGVLAAIFEEIGVKHRRFVDLGCGDNGGNSGYLAADLGWTGLMVDGSKDAIGRLRREFNSRNVAVKQAWITREDIDDLLTKFGGGGKVDLLSIDIDGNDIWVWDAISECLPRVVCVEYNTILGPERSVAVPYSPAFERDPRLLFGRYFGASLAALERIGRRKGYRLVAVENVNAFFVRRGVGRRVPAAPVPLAYRLYEKDARYLDRLGDVYAAFEREGLELVEVA